MRFLPLLVAASAQYAYDADWWDTNWSPFRTAETSPYYGNNYGAFVQTNSPAISLAQTVGCDACTGSGCPSGTTCHYNSLSYNPQSCEGVCSTPETGNYYNGNNYYGFLGNPYNLYNAYHTPSSSYNTPPDWGRCTGFNDCLSCVNTNGCGWSGTYCSFSTAIQCTGGGCAFQPRQCPSSTSGTCAGQTTCQTCTSTTGCAWSGSTCYLTGTPCTTFGCANTVSQCQNTGGVVPVQCGVNEVWESCGSSNCHEDNCQDYYTGGNRVCLNNCWSGCQCAPGGYARMGSVCVPRSQCPQSVGYSSYYGR